MADESQDENQVAEEEELTLERVHQLTESEAREEVEQFGLAQAVLKHWREFRPKMCAELEKKHQLQKSVMVAAFKTFDLLQELQFGPAKLPYDRARELAYREWYLLPDEEEQPSLTLLGRR